MLAQAEYSTSTYYVFRLHTGYGLYEHLLGASHGPGPRLFSTRLYPGWFASAAQVGNLAALGRRHMLSPA